MSYDPYGKILDELATMQSPYERVGYLKAVVNNLTSALATIVDVAPGAGEDVSYAIAKRALDRSAP